MSTSLDLQQDFGDSKDFWVFGYGSILWNPGFSYTDRMTGYVDDYSRRFWQGSTTHRGTSQSPGRVATLVKHKGSRVWGSVFRVVGSSMIEACLQHLGVRECQLGGYEVLAVKFVQATDSNIGPRVDDNNEPSRPPPTGRVTTEPCRKAWTFVATPNNHLYLGPATVEDLAAQVVNSSGSSGPNCDYVTRLADYVRSNIPQDKDSHLFELDSTVRRLLVDRLHLTSSTGSGTTASDKQVNKTSKPSALSHWEQTTVSDRLLAVTASAVTVRIC